ncbi:unnamed protein product [Bursaphelenchus xylophilus]|uniref:(pine wood nematode) hypothetical protein n=1 Tax=Bursaphelenchus xylophilus TaxID=6326 RepID=A0A1I7RKY7_BURXY|nr:unnamed protein product [Bursaphelenchus xylophilus]CAG9083704.1 unnamed protein product [Bursaphelenchus xylophilus]
MADDPKPIIVLSDDVVNKIAAGEVVVRPMNAVKEMMENSLDAGATEITITIKNGGLDLIKVKDNGKGIRQEDYENVCERFATSKLETIGDLQRMATFGFRGEALASLSCMAKVVVTSKTRQSAHAWTCTYENCKPTTACTPSAGLQGTQIIVDKLFSAYPHRRATFKHPHDEAVQIISLVSKYSANFPDVAFSVVRHDGKGSFRSLGNGDRHAVIKMCNPTVTRDLFDFTVKDENLQFEADICMAHPLSAFTSKAVAARQQKQRLFQIFINNRSVSCNKLKSALDLTFSSKDSYCAFIHVSMRINPARMDVNVHPTKEYVYFLDETEIIETIQKKLLEVLENFSHRGVIEMSKPNKTLDITNNKIQPKITSFCQDTGVASTVTGTSQGTKRRADGEPVNKQSDYFKKKIAPKLMVRVDARNRTLDEFFGESDNTAGNVTFTGRNNRVDEDNKVITEEEMERSSQRQKMCVEIQGILRKRISESSNPRAQRLFKYMILVGFIDSKRASFQSENLLLLVDYLPVLEELFYQRCVNLMGNLSRRRLILNPEEGGIPLIGLIDKYLDVHHEIKLPGETAEKNRNAVVDELVANLCSSDVIEMLWESFGICVQISEELGPCIQTILCLVDGYTPLLALQLPRFAFELVSCDYGKTHLLHHQISRALARLHTPYAISSLKVSDHKRHQKLIKCQLFPLFKTHITPPDTLGPYIKEVMSTMNAFKIFGRC